MGARFPIGTRRASWRAGLFAWLILSFMLACNAAVAGDLGDLYRARVLVTGQREETRLPALGRGFRDVLIKVSGDPAIVDDPAAAGLAAEAKSYVDAFQYRDLMAGIPVHDEQGTRDRPYELTIDFNPEKIRGALRTLGREPWAGERPRVVVFLAVDFDAVTYLLASDGDRGRDQRESLDAAAWKFGLPMVLPTKQLLAESDMTFDNLLSTDRASLDAAAKMAGGDVGFVGRLTWSPEELGWIADWQLARDGKRNEWQIRGVNFDEAFRNAMSGALQILSNHGAPQ